MILELNKQRVTSDYIELYQLQTPDGWLYFTTHEAAVYMRDKEKGDDPDPANWYPNRLYSSLPIDFTGWEQKSEGTYARPAITFVNILTTFSDALGNFDNDDLIGRKIVRRKTLAIHLDNAGGTAHGAPAAPTEFPVQSYVIDRIASMDATTVTFELASPFDVSGVMIPARSILPNACCWSYQAAATDTPFATSTGACTWKLAANNNGVVAFFDARNSLFASTAIHTLSSITGTAAGPNDFFRTAKALTRVNVDGSYTTTGLGDKAFDYWQAADSGTVAYRRMRPYSTYNGATPYYTFIEGDLYNDVVLYDNKTLWVCIKSHTSGQTPAIGSKYWKRADICGKKLSSCAIRYKSQSATAARTGGATISVLEDSTKVLQYGGFPASRRYGFTG